MLARIAGRINPLPAFDLLHPGRFHEELTLGFVERIEEFDRSGRQLSRDGCRLRRCYRGAWRQNRSNNSIYPSAALLPVG